MVQDPAAFVAAMDADRASPTGSKTPNTVVLSQNIVNGDYAGTRGVTVFFPNTASVDQSRMMNANSNDWMTISERHRGSLYPRFMASTTIPQSKSCLFQPLIYAEILPNEHFGTRFKARAAEITRHKRQWRRRNTTWRRDICASPLCSYGGAIMEPSQTRPSSRRQDPSRST